MYAVFKYYCPKSLEELFALLSRCESDAKIYAGGTDLLVLLRAKKITTKNLIDIKKIPELNSISETQEYIRIGATATFADIAESSIVKKWAPALATAAKSVGSAQIRFKGTIGGNIQTASPAGDGMNAAWGLNAKIDLLSQSGTRRVYLEDFILGSKRTSLNSNEIISAVYIPKIGWDYQSFFKIGRRNAMAISVVNGIVALKKNVDNKIETAIISLGSVAPTPIRIQIAEELLIGKSPNLALAEEIGNIVTKYVNPISDIRAGAAYRAYIAGISVKREIQKSIKMVGGK